MKVSPGVLTEKKNLLAALETERQPFKAMWRELADFILPTRYAWLMNDNERRKMMTKNPNIIDGTATNAARILASGMLNGITSPSRPWFKLRLKRNMDANNYQVRRWLDEVERLILQAMADTNFYNSLATMYLDLAIFGTSAVLIYEDYKSVFRCYNASLGEYYLGNSSTGLVNTFARKFVYTARQCADRFGVENLPWQVKLNAEAKDAKQLQTYTVAHLVEANDGKIPQVPKMFEFRELFWIDSAASEGTAINGDEVLSARGYNELPGIFPRWEVAGNDAYGSSPGMDALGDIIQLQHEQKRKGQSLDYMIRPPLVADIQLQHRPTALLPAGVTFVAGINNVGAKPVYQITPPIQEITMDIREVQGRIREFFHNDLFKMISQLETVRTATEIDARREEKLVLLGPVLERTENEGLDQAISRIYGIMTRADLLPPAPEELAGEELEIQYVSILSAAQSAVGAAPLERWLAFIGQIAAIRPDAINIPNWDELIRDYGRDIGVKAKHVMSIEEAAERTQAQEEMLKAREMANQGTALVDAGKTLSETPVGGGSSALQQLLSS